MFKRIHYPFLFAMFISLIAVVGIDMIITLRVKGIVDLTTTGELDSFLEKALIVVGFVVLSLPTNVIYNMFKGLFVKASLKQMKHRYIKKVFKKNINEFQKDNNALYLSSLTNDYNLIETNYLEPIADILVGLCFFASGVILISLVSPWILVIGLSVCIINIIVSVISAKPAMRHNKQRSELFSNYTAYIKEVLSAFHIIKTNNLVNKVKQDFHEKSEEVQHKGYIIDKIFSYVSAIQQTNFNLTFSVLLIAVGFMAFNGDITLGGVILIVQSSDKLVWPLMQMSETFPKIFSVQSIFNRIEESLKNHETYEETIPFEQFEAIRLNHVHFAYDDAPEDDVLKDVNMEFKRGGKYLIVGPSGGGKSTVLKLLRKYFNPKSGELLVDNTPLQAITKESYFANIANVEQQVFLFEDTIRNNLTLYKEYPEEEILEAIHKAGLDEFVKGLVNGLDTIITNNGSNISGGERSRIAIARGLINHAQIIFLDEAFASLDFEKAKEIEKSILDCDVTVINVSHVVFEDHLEDYDQVYVVKNNTVVTQ
jgi:ATP-binding cassette, subfamily B, bacterial